MDVLIQRIMIGFLAAFVAACAAVVVYQVVWVAPAERCEKGGGWWDPGQRECGKVIYIPDLTGRYVDDRGRERRVLMPTPAPAQPQPPAPSPSPSA
jgi:hypothetical protein